MNSMVAFPKAEHALLSVLENQGTGGNGIIKNNGTAYPHLPDDDALTKPDSS